MIREHLKNIGYALIGCFIGWGIAQIIIATGIIP